MQKTETGRRQKRKGASEETRNCGKRKIGGWQFHIKQRFG